jgi:hypothetical protein
MKIEEQNLNDPLNLQSNIAAVIGSILAELEERKQWAENGMMVYSDDTNMRLEYQARIEEIENAIWTVNQYCL